MHPSFANDKPGMPIHANNNTHKASDHRCASAKIRTRQDPVDTWRARILLPGPIDPASSLSSSIQHSSACMTRQLRQQRVSRNPYWCMRTVHGWLAISSPVKTWKGDRIRQAECQTMRVYFLPPAHVRASLLCLWCRSFNEAISKAAFDS
jgi:hypothetical protein